MAGPCDGGHTAFGADESDGAADRVQSHPQGGGRCNPIEGRCVALGSGRRFRQADRPAQAERRSPRPPDLVVRSSLVTSTTVTLLPPAFRRLAWSNLAAQSAEQVGLAAAPLVALLMLGAGAGEAGLLQMAQTLPFLLLALPAGVLADRTSRRRLMVGAEGLRLAALLGILAVASLGGLSLPLLALLGFLGAAGTVAYSVAAPSLVPALVPGEALSAANGRLELARSVAFTAGPALAGGLVAWG